MRDVLDIKPRQLGTLELRQEGVTILLVERHDLPKIVVMDERGIMNDNAGDPYSPSMYSDGTACQAGKNVVYAVPGGWYNACSLGVSGDWVMYVKYRSLKVTAAGGV